MSLINKISTIPPKVFGFFFLSPALSFFSAILRIRKGDFSACWIIPFIMGIFAYLFPPYSDFARNLNLVYEFKDLSFDDFSFYISDYVVPGSERFFILNNIPIEIFRFLYTFIVYWWFTNIFYDLNNKFHFSKRKGFLLWSILFMGISFFSYITNLRTQFAVYVIFYGLYNFIYKNKKKYIFLLVFGAFVHIAYVPVIIVAIASKYIHIHINRKIKLFICILILFNNFFSDNVSFFMDFVKLLPLNGILESKLEIYTTGEWSANGDMMKNMQTSNFLIYKSLSNFSLYYSIYLYLRYEFHSFLESYHAMLFIILFILVPVPSIFTRYLEFFESAVMLHLIIGYSENFIPEKRIKTLLVLYILTTILNIYAYWNCLVNGNVYYLLLPLPLALVQTYDFHDWCLKHLSSDFNQFINKSF